MNNVLSANNFLNPTAMVLAIALVSFLVLFIVIVDYIRTSRAYRHDKELIKAQIREATIAKDKAMEEIAIKNAVVNSISEEILTPINAVRTVIALLNKEDISDEIREYCDILKLSSDSLAHTASDALGYSDVDLYDDIVKDQTGMRLIIPTAHVLIVDDNKVNLRVARSLLNSFRADVISVDNAYEAIDRIRSGEKFDIIFMDHMMPGMDGIEAAEQIRKLYGYSFVPIIGLSATITHQLEKDFFNSGMCDFLEKPIVISRLTEVLKRWVPKDKQQVVKISDIVLESSTEIYRPERAIKDYWNDFEIYKRILLLFLENGDEICPTLEQYNRDNIEIELAKFARFTRSIRATKLESLINSLLEAATSPDGSLYPLRVNAVKDEYVRVREVINEYLDSNGVNEGK